MTFLRRYKAIIAYLFLAGAIAFSINQESTNSANSRRDLAQQTEITLVKACERNNNLRITLQGLYALSDKSIGQYVKDGTITEHQGERAHKQIAEAITRIAPEDCKKLYRQPKAR